MGFFTRKRIFQKAATVIFAAYMITMVIVTINCFKRKSGNTGMDMSMIQKMRFEVKADKDHIAENE